MDAALSPNFALPSALSRNVMPSSTVSTPFSSAAIYLSAAAGFSLPSSIVSSHSCAAAFRSGSAYSTAISARVLSARLSRMVFWPRYMPKPCSALSSNRLFAQAGPLPDRRLRVYGDVAAGPPQMDEQPVALEIYIRSPYNWVIRRA